jgi:hypothetical protein
MRLLRAHYRAISPGYRLKGYNYDHPSTQQTAP